MPRLDAENVHEIILMTSLVLTLWFFISASSVAMPIVTWRSIIISSAFLNRPRVVYIHSLCHFICIVRATRMVLVSVLGRASGSCF